MQINYSAFNPLSSTRVHFASNNSQDAERKALERKLKLLMEDVPADSFSNQSREIQFTPSTSKPVTSPAPDTTMPKGFLPLSREAACVIPPVVARPPEPAPDTGLAIAEQLQTLIDLKMAQRPQSSSAQPAQDARLLAQRQRQEEVLKEKDKQHQTARQKLLNLGGNAVALGTFSGVMLSLPLNPVGVATMLPALLKYASSMIGTVTDLINNKQTIRAAKSLFSDAIGGIKRLLGFGGKKSVRFTGSETQQTNTVTMTKTIETYQQRLIEAAEQFNQTIDSATTETEQKQIAQTVQRKIVSATQAVILEQGSETEKAKIRKLQWFQAANDTLCAAFTRPEQELFELPPVAQNHLRQMIFETLTSELPELQEWGKVQAKAIGMTDQRINRLLSRSV
jgi:hypothetical protein